MQTILFGVIAIPFLLFGANMIVRNGRQMALQLGISEFFIGLTVLSVGTSVPEIFTHIVSSLRILSDPVHTEVLSGIAIGTNLGSNIVQITAIVGIVGLLGKIRTTERFMKRDYLVMLLGIALLWFFAWTDQLLTRWEGMVLVLGYIAYLWYLVQLQELDEKLEDHPQYHPAKAVGLICLGLIFVVAAAEFLLDAAIFASESYGLSGSLIGAVIVGVCTALPELTTALVAVRSKAKGLSAGTLIGSNITNPMLGIGLGAGISTYPVAPEILQIDLPFWFAVSLIGWLFFREGFLIKKWQAFLLAASYLLYLYLRIGT